VLAVLAFRMEIRLAKVSSALAPRRRVVARRHATTRRSGAISGRVSPPYECRIARRWIARMSSAREPEAMPLEVDGTLRAPLARLPGAMSIASRPRSVSGSARNTGPRHHDRGRWAFTRHEFAQLESCDLRARFRRGNAAAMRGAGKRTATIPRRHPQRRAPSRRAGHRPGALRRII